MHGQNIRLPDGTSLKKLPKRPMPIHAIKCRRSDGNYSKEKTVAGWTINSSITQGDKRSVVNP
jgi:hypothetical protein